MKKQRHNINTIAEVLIDELEAMKVTADKIEKAAKTPLKINDDDIRSSIWQYKTRVEENIKLQEKLHDQFKKGFVTWNKGDFWFFMLFQFVAFCFMMGMAYQLRKESKSIEKATIELVNMRTKFINQIDPKTLKKMYKK